LTLALALGFSLASGPAGAQASYPNKPIRLLVGFDSGGMSDVAARVIAEPLGKLLGQTIVIMNRPGANGSLASAALTEAAPDGYTLLFSGPQIYGPDQFYFGKSVRYEGIRDFTPITQLIRTPFVLTTGSTTGLKSVRDVVAAARKDPGGLTYTSSGPGSLNHMMGVKFEQAFGVTMTHVPFKGGAQGAQALIAGDVKLGFSSPSTVTPFFQAGRMTPLGVTSRNRATFLPDVPSLSEQGAGEYDLVATFGLFGPANLPKDIANTVHRATVKVLQDPALRQRLLDLGNESAPSESPEAYARQVVREGAEYRDLMIKGGVKPQH
jgi:tripartite-type tricarboxylate transporter receptor subunit TctC